MFLLRRNQVVDLPKQELQTVPVLSTDADHFLNFFLFRCFFYIFTVANQLPGFSICRLARVEDFLNVKIFFNCKYKCECKQFFI